MQNHKKVIPFPLGDSGWRFFDFLLGDTNEIETWYQGLSEGGQDTFDSLLKNNAKAETPRHWIGSKMLQGECKAEGIWEWRFFDNDRQQRVLGIFGAGRKEAFFLIGCSHKGKVYDPPNALETSIKRAKAIRTGRANVSQRKIKKNL